MPTEREAGTGFTVPDTMEKRPLHEREVSVQRRNAWAVKKYQQRLQTRKVWIEVALDLNTGFVISVIVSFFALGLVLGCLLFGLPGDPAVGTWPSYGYFLTVPDCAAGFVGVVADSIRNRRVIQASALIVAGFVVLDLYSLIANLAWIYYSFLGTLSAAASAHQTTSATFFATVILLFIMFLNFRLALRYFTVSNDVYDLMRQYGLISDDELDEIADESAA